MILSICLLILGFICLRYGAEFLLNGSKSLALKLHLPEMLIGLTVVAMGTSVPEAAISINSALKGVNGIVFGNIIGSNIANILLILGVTAMISATPIRKNAIRFEIPFVFLITILITTITYYSHAVDRVYGFLLLMIFFCYIVYRYKTTKQITEEIENVILIPVWKIVLFIVFGSLILILGSDLTVNSATDIAHRLNISNRIIGLTLVALGTSLPELVVCAVAAIKKHADLAIGNILGSNIFNILFVLGTTAMVVPVETKPVFITDCLIACASVLLLFVLAVRDRKLSRFNGVIFFTAYIGYVCFLFFSY